MKLHSSAPPPPFQCECQKSGVLYLIFSCFINCSQTLEEPLKSPSSSENGNIQVKRFQLPPRSITSTLLSVSRSLPLCIRLGGVGWADEDRAGENEIPGWRSKTPLMQEEPPKNAVQGKVTIRFCILVRPLWKLLRVQLWSSSDMRSWNRAGTGGAAEAVKQAGPVATEARETGLIRCDELYVSRVSHWTTKNTGCMIAWCVVLKYSGCCCFVSRKKKTKRHHPALDFSIQTQSSCS